MRDWFDDEFDTPIFKQCADKDLVYRLSGLKQHPETGQLYNRDRWKREKVFNKKKENKDEEMEDEEEQVWLKGKHLLPRGLPFPVFGVSSLFFIVFQWLIEDYYFLHSCISLCCII